MEGDTAVRRLKSSLNNVSHVNREGSGCEDARKKKQEASFVLGEGVACALVAVFICALWVCVHWSLKQLVVGKPTGEFNATRAR